MSKKKGFYYSFQMTLVIDLQYSIYGEIDHYIHEAHILFIHWHVKSIYKPSTSLVLEDLFLYPVKFSSGISSMT